MTSCSALPLDDSLQQRVLYELAKHFWGTVSFREGIQDEFGIEYLIENLTIHRESVLSQLPEIFNCLKNLSARNPKHLIRKILNAFLNLHQGYYEAIVWEKKYEESLQFTILNPGIAGRYQASNFIGATGHFDDLAWVKLYISDKKMDELFQFEMSCFYCLEDLTRLWESVKISDIYTNLNFLPILHAFHCTNDLVILWAYQLEDRFEEFSNQNALFDIEFHTSSLYEALFHGQDYAVDFFWERCNDNEKRVFLRDYDHDYIIKAAEDNYSGSVHFLYSLLSSRHANLNVFVELFRFERMATIWACLLQSRFYRCALNDILTFPENIPMPVYSRILDLLISNIELRKYAFVKDVFSKLYIHFTTMEGSQDVEINPNLITNFIKLKEIDLVATVIETWPIAVKDKMLIQDWLGAGKSAVDEISNRYNYDVMLSYFVSFLMGRNSTAQALTLRADASSFLERLKQGKLINWMEIDETVKQEVFNIFDILQDTLSLLESLPRDLPQAKMQSKTLLLAKDLTRCHF